MTEREKIIDFARAQIGVCEEPKGSNKQKYGEYLDSTEWYLYKDGSKVWVHKVNGFDWCTQTVDAIYCMVFGIEKARNMLHRPIYNNYGAVVKYAYNYFKCADSITTKPEPGNVVYFQRNGELCHTGICSKVENGRVYVIEGNAGKNNWYVVENNYSINDNYIYGYGVPAYTESKYPDTPYTAKCCLNGVAIRSAPYSDSSIIGYIHKDDVLTIEDMAGSSGDFGLIHGYVYIPGGFIVEDKNT